MTGHAVVVGGTKGLGLEVVERFLARGLHVTVLSRTPSPKHLDNDRIRHVAIDLETLSAAGDINWTSICDAGPLNYLVLTQRYRGNGDPWTGELQVGLNASRILIESSLEHFAAAGDKAIGVVSSVYASFAGSSQPVGYHVVKAGLNGMVRYYGWALGRKKIRINAIMPLSYVKDETRSFFSTQVELNRLYSHLVPLGRMGTSRENADAIDFLCSEKSSFVTGQCLFIDGGVSVVWPEETAHNLSRSRDGDDATG